MIINRRREAYVSMSHQREEKRATLPFLSFPVDVDRDDVHLKTLSDVRLKKRLQTFFFGRQFISSYLRTSPPLPHKSTDSEIDINLRTWF